MSYQPSLTKHGVHVMMAVSTVHVMMAWTMIAETGLNNAFRSTCTLYSGRSIPQALSLWIFISIYM